ncbi:S8 family serine peptidase [Candidatus Woesearchaeota archaeon]|nr:S8 family serine peptidase [Candidatus Woesearchaeota archaeon]
MVIFLGVLSSFWHGSITSLSFAEEVQTIYSNVTLTETGIVELNIDNANSLRVSGVVNAGTARIYYQDANNSLFLVFDSEQSNVSVFDHACVDTCSLEMSDVKLLVVLRGENASLTLSNITHTFVPVGGDISAIPIPDVRLVDSISLNLSQYFVDSTGLSLDYDVSVPDDVRSVLSDDVLFLSWRKAGVFNAAVFASNRRVNVSTSFLIIAEEKNVVNNTVSVDDRIAEEFLKRKKVPVIILLKNPVKNAFVLQNKKALLEQKKVEVDVVQDAVISELEKSNNVTVAVQDVVFGNSITGAQVVEVVNTTIVNNTFTVNKEYDTVNAIAAEISPEALEVLKNDPNVVAVIYDLMFNISLQDAIPLIKANDAHALVLSNNDSVVGNGQSVCIIDTGIDYNHPAFGGKVIGGIDFVNSDFDAMDDNVNSHGTHIAGIVSAVAPSSMIVPVKVCDSSGGCSASNILSGIDYCVNRSVELNISVISGSLGDGGQYDASNCPDWFDSAFGVADSLGVVSVFASGNDGYLNGVSYPACSPFSISVGATDKSDNIAGFSNRGSRLDVFAPGVVINSTVRGGGYGTLSGTSMSAPFVSGAVALLKQVAKAQQQSLSLNATRQTLKTTGVVVGSWSRIDVLNATLSLIGGNVSNVTNGTSDLVYRYISPPTTPDIEVEFRDVINKTRLEECGRFGKNVAFINSSLCPELNKSAKIIFNRVHFVENISVLRNDVLCPTDVCTNLTIGQRISLSAENATITGIDRVSFNVREFSTYSLNGSSSFSVSTLANACGLINESITLTNNVTAAGGSCFDFNTSNILFDCAGYNITSNPQGVISFNISVVNGAQLSNITIQNCNIQNFSIGINISSASNISLFNNNITNVTNGIWLNNTATSVLENNTANASSGYGLYLTNSSNNTINKGNFLNVYNQFSLYLSSSQNNVVMNTTANTAFNSSGLVLYLSFNNIILNSTGTGGNSSTILSNGIFLNSSSNNSIINSTGISTLSKSGSSSVNGIWLYLSSNNTISGSTGTAGSSKLAGTGIDLRNSSNNKIIDSTGTGGTIVGSGGAGISIRVVSENNQVISSTGNGGSGDNGIFISSNNNTINLSTGNGGNTNSGSNSGQGIFLSSANNNTIISSTGTGGNSGSGTGGSSGNGIRLFSSSNNIIISSTGTGSTTNGGSSAQNTSNGILLQLSSNNTIINSTGNGGSSNSNTPIDTGNGIAIVSGGNNTINSSVGIRGSGGKTSGLLVSSTNNNVLLNNTFQANNDVAAIFVIQSNNINFTNNTLIGTTGLEINRSNQILITNTSFQSTTYSIKAALGSNFSLVDNPRMTNYTFANTPSVTITATGFASVNFFNIINANGTNLSMDVNLTTANRVHVNTSRSPGLNVSANVTISNLGSVGYLVPQVDYTDLGTFVDCLSPTCIKFRGSNGEVVFNVSSFTTYRTAVGCGLINESVTLVKNVNTVLASCFDFNQSNILFNCAGYNITSNPFGVQAFNISVVNSAQLNNITIQNCNIMNFSIGINVSSAVNISLFNNNITNVSDGIWLNNSRENLLQNNTINATTGIALYLSNTSGSLFTNNTFNSTIAVFATTGSNNNNFTNTVLFGNTGFEVNSSANVTITNSVFNTIWSIKTAVGSNISLTDNKRMTNYTFANTPSLTITSTGLASVNFFNIINANGTNLSQDVNLTASNQIHVNTSRRSGLNTTANITLFGVSSPLIYAAFDDINFELCPANVCSVPTINRGNTLFNVSHFTTYQWQNVVINITVPLNNTIVRPSTNITINVSELNGLDFVDKVNVTINNETVLMSDLNNNNWTATFIIRNETPRILNVTALGYNISVGAGRNVTSVVELRLDRSVGEATAPSQILACSNQTYVLNNTEVTLKTIYNLDTLLDNLNFSVKNVSGLVSNLSANTQAIDLSNYQVESNYTFTALEEGQYNITSVISTIANQTFNSSFILVNTRINTTFNVTGANVTTITIRDVCGKNTINQSLGRTSLLMPNNSRFDLQIDFENQPLLNITPFVLNNSNSIPLINTSIDYNKRVNETAPPSGYKRVDFWENNITNLKYDNLTMRYDYNSIEFSVERENRLRLYRCDDLPTCTLTRQSITLDTTGNIVTAVYPGNNLSLARFMLVEPAVTNASALRAPIVEEFNVSRKHPGINELVNITAVLNFTLGVFNATLTVNGTVVNVQNITTLVNNEKFIYKFNFTPANLGSYPVVINAVDENTLETNATKSFFVNARANVTLTGSGFTTLTLQDRENNETIGTATPPPLSLEVTTGRYNFRLEDATDGITALMRNTSVTGSMAVATLTAGLGATVQNKKVHAAFKLPSTSDFEFVDVIFNYSSIISSTAREQNLQLFRCSDANTVTLNATHINCTSWEDTNATVDTTGIVLRKTLAGLSSFAVGETLSEVTETVSQTIVSSGGGGIAAAKRTVAALSFVAPQQSLIMHGRDEMTVLFTVKNTGKITLNDIKLDAHTDTKDLTLRLERNSIASLAPGESEQVRLFVQSHTDPAVYEIIITAAASNVQLVQTAKVYITLEEISELVGTEQTITEIRTAQDVLQQNPQCFELGEFLTQAENALKERKYEKARSLASAAIQGCNELVAYSAELQNPVPIIDLEKLKLFLIIGITVVSIVVVIGGYLLGMGHRHKGEPQKYHLRAPVRRVSGVGRRVLAGKLPWSKGRKRQKAIEYEEEKVRKQLSAKKELGRAPGVPFYAPPAKRRF